jgi:hypothetical protein
LMFPLPFVLWQNWHLLCAMLASFIYLVIIEI